MGIPQYLAMTDGEIAACARLPQRLARMGCHFSDDGLVELPQVLPGGALLVVDDRVPMAAQDPEHMTSWQKLWRSSPAPAFCWTSSRRKMHRSGSWSGCWPGS